MSKKKIPSDSKRRLAFFGTLSVLAIILFFGQLFSYTYKIYNLKKEIANLNEKLENEKFTEKELRQEIEKFSNDEYKAKYIREHYSYSKDGEYIIKIKEKEKTKKDVSFKQYITNIIKNINIDYEYMIYGAIIIIIIIIILKSRTKKY